MSTENKYYVYEHWRPDKGICFYVGKGKGRRAYSMRDSRNQWHTAIVKKLNSLGLSVDVRFSHVGVSDERAMELEIERISFWRSQGVQLVNLTDGGEGCQGYKHTEEAKRANGDRKRGVSQSAETRAKRSASLKGLKKSDEWKAKISAAHVGKTFSKESREKMSATRTGRKLSEETRLKMSASQKARNQKKKKQMMLNLESGD